MKIIAAILVRSVLVLACTTLPMVAISSVSPKGDANIGAGLMMFMVVLALAFLGAMLDAKRHEGRFTLIVWLGVALVVGISSAFGIAIGDGALREGAGLDWPTLRSDLTGVSPFVAGLVAVPAWLGSLVGGSMRRDQIARASH